MPIPRYRTTSTPIVNETRLFNKRLNKQANTTYYNPATSTNQNLDFSKSIQHPGTSKWISDWVTPSFSKLVKMGRIINNPMHMHEETETNPFVWVDYTKIVNYNMLSVPEGNIRGVYPYQVYTINGDYQASMLGCTTYLDPVSYEDIEILQAKAITKAWARINESDVLVAATLKESSKTARDLHLLARKTLKAVKFVRHPRPPKNFNFKKLKEFTAEMEELYMQARYNLRPLYYDIIGLTKLATGESDLKRTRRNVHDRYTIRGTETESISVSDSQVVASGYLSGVNLQVSRSSTCEVEVRAGVLCRAGELTRWEQSGLALLPETAWELTPFSFILDWFGNFGEVISSWAPKPGIDPITSWVVTDVVKTQTISSTPVSVSDTAPHSLLIGQIWDTQTTCQPFTVSRVKTVRDVWRKVNPPRPFSPHLDVNLDPLKILDLAVIGKNLAKSIRRFRS